IHVEVVWDARLPPRRAEPLGLDGLEATERLERVRSPRAIPLVAGVDHRDGLGLAVGADCDRYARHRLRRAGWTGVPDAGRHEHVVLPQEDERVRGPWPVLLDPRVLLDPLGKTLIVLGIAHFEHLVFFGGSPPSTHDEAAATTLIQTARNVQRRRRSRTRRI